MKELYEMRRLKLHTYLILIPVNYLIYAHLFGHHNIDGA